MNEIEAAINRLDAFRDTLLNHGCGESHAVFPRPLAILIGQQIHQVWALGFGNIDYKCSDESRDHLVDLFEASKLTAINPNMNVRICSGCLRVQLGTLLAQLRRVKADIDTVLDSDG